VLYLASAVLLVGGVLALRLPEQVDEERANDPGVATAARFALHRSAAVVTGPLAAALALRALAGLLTIFLAFLLRADGAAGAVVVAVVIAAAAGQIGGTTAAARLPEKATPVLQLLALGLPLVTCLLAALTGADAWVVAAAGATGVSVSLSRFGVDAAVQKHVPPRAISTAFARCETGPAAVVGRGRRAGAGAADVDVGRASGSPRCCPCSACWRRGSWRCGRGAPRVDARRRGGLALVAELPDQAHPVQSSKRPGSCGEG
jgi:hypothetical protein